MTELKLQEGRLGQVDLTAVKGEAKTGVDVKRNVGAKMSAR